MSTSRRVRAAGALAFVALLLAGCSRAPDAPPAAPAAAAGRVASKAGTTAAPADDGVAWRKPNGEAEVDALFAEARDKAQPVFLYWGAAWCPPCNQVKATVFNRADFIDRSRAFVPVYLDGDQPGAQKLGERFKVRGYPTMILLRPDGTELTRLPGEVDAARYLQVLALGLGEARPMKDLLAQAQRTPSALAGSDWHRLAYYAWDTDEQQLLPKPEQAALLQRLASTCPPDQAEAATRLMLKALVVRTEAAPPADAAAKKAGPSGARSTASQPTDARTRERVMAMLADDKLARENLDLVTYYAKPLSGALAAPGTPEREQLVATWAAALDRLTADPRLSQGDRIAALAARVELAKPPPGGAGAPGAGLSEVLLEHVRSQVARAEREVTNPIERQSVVPNAADVLSEAGLLDESDRVLKAELDRSITPYYAMLGLAANAKERGDKAGALAWYERAYRGAQGPATRVQWGSIYVSALVELSPQDTARIGQAAGSVLGELEAQPDAFYARNAARLQRMGRALAGWGRGGEAAVSLQRLREQRDVLCAALPASDPQRATCEGLLADPAKAGGERGRSAAAAGFAPAAARARI